MLSQLLVRLAFARFIASRSGATAIEYGLLAASIAVAIIAAIGVLGDEVVAMYNTIKIQITP